MGKTKENIDNPSASRLAQVFFYSVFAVALIFGSLIMVTYENSYKRNPDFAFLPIMIYLLPLLAAFGILTYYKQQQSKQKSYAWLILSVFYTVVIIVWQIAQKKAMAPNSIPYDFISGNNFFGFALGIYNLIMLMPLIFFPLMGGYEFISIPKAESGKHRQIKKITAVIAILLLALSLRSLLLKAVSGEISSGFLSTSIINGTLTGRDSDESGEYLTLNFNNENYTRQDINLNFIINSDTEFFNSQGQKIDEADLQAKAVLRIFYVVTEDGNLAKKVAER